MYKKFFTVPRSPPNKILMDIQRERMTLPETEADVSTAKITAPPSGESLEDRRRRRKQRENFTRREKKKAVVQTVKEEVQEVEEKPVFKPYVGDVFGTGGNYMGGMVYLSRLPANDLQFGNKKRGGVFGDDAKAKAKDRGSRPSLSDPMKLPTMPSGDNMKAREAKLHCAASLANWAQHDVNVERLAKEGAVPAAILLSKEDDGMIRKYCAATFRHMSHKRLLCEQLVQNSAVPIVSELAVAAKDRNVSRDCGIALVNMTTMDGIEGKLVEDGVVLALMSLMNQYEDLAELCARGLFNLTCVDAPFTFVERVIKSFVSLASAATLEVKHICASALCNLSDLKAVRYKIVEEGVVQVLGLLARGAEAKTRRVCAIILHSLASSQVCRADMVAKGAVQVLYMLSSDVDTITLHYIASAIISLSYHEDGREGNVPRLINEGGVTALYNICLRCPKIPSTTQLCASALSLLSLQKIGRDAIVNEGCIQALVTLLHEANDSQTLRHGLSALTNLLVDADNHKPVHSQGAITSVINLCNHEHSGIREACALALFNFSRGTIAREQGVSTTAIPAIIALSRLPEPKTRMRCAATLCKLASVEANVPLMVKEGVVPAFIEMLKTQDQEIVKHCCAALCHLAHEGSSGVMIAEGAVPHVIGTVESGDTDDTTKQSCCAVLSILSAHEQCRPQLCTMGTLPALMKLAKVLPAFLSCPPPRVFDSLEVAVRLTF